jgi:hypothetical protein
MTSKANPPEIVRKSAEACAELIPSKSGERYQKQFSHFCKWKSENNVKKITEEKIRNIVSQSDTFNMPQGDITHNLIV